MYSTLGGKSKPLEFRFPKQVLRFPKRWQSRCLTHTGKYVVLFVMSKKRSVFLGEALLKEVRGLASRQHRTVSGQVCWLAEIGLGESALAVDPADSLDDSDGRHFIYPDTELDERLVSSARKYDASYSSVVRSLVLSGLTLVSTHNCRFCKAYIDE